MKLHAARVSRVTSGDDVHEENDQYELSTVVGKAGWVCRPAS